MAMNIHDLATMLVYDDPVWADVAEVVFAGTDVCMKCVVTNDGVRSSIVIRCSEVADYRIADHYFESLRVEQDSLTMMAHSGEATTYVMWGEAVDWPRVVGRITQELGHIPGVLAPDYVRETISRPDYRLPALIPAAVDDKFQELIHGLGVQAYVHQRRAGVAGLQMLSFGHSSYVIAKDFEVTADVT